MVQLSEVMISLVSTGVVSTLSDGQESSTDYPVRFLRLVALLLKLMLRLSKPNVSIAQVASRAR